jgi:hypothetical protein
MNGVLRSCVPFGLVLALVGVVLAGSAAAAPGAGPAGPALTAASAMAEAPWTVAVAGTAFTPGGRVYVALYDVWGTTLFETRWTTANPTTYGRDGSQDPAAGFGRGGTIDERFERPCGAAVMARAYDAATASWSNWLDVDAAGAGIARYGPDGSQDPALGGSLRC